MFAEAVHSHKALRYLDVSDNAIKSQDFIYLFKPISKGVSKIAEMHMKNNLIGGDDINIILLCSSQNLRVLDLSGNNLDN